MTDLDIQTAQLIIQLAREDIYGLDGSPDDALVSDLEFALAVQEQEFMQHWMGYGDAQFRPGDRLGPSGGGGGVGLVHDDNVNQTSMGASITVTPALAPAPQLVAGTGTSTSTSRAVDVAGIASSSSSPAAARATSSSHTLRTSNAEAGPSRLATISNQRPAPSTHAAHEATRQSLTAARPLVIVYDPPAEEQPLIEWAVDEAPQTIRDYWSAEESYEPPPAGEQRLIEWAVELDEGHQTASDSEWGVEEHRPESPQAVSESDWVAEEYRPEPAQTVGDVDWGAEEYRPPSVASEHSTADEFDGALGLLPGDDSPVPPASPTSEHSDHYYEVYNEWLIGAAVEVERAMSASGHSTSENEALPPISHHPSVEGSQDEDASVKMLRFNNLLCEMLGVGPAEVAPRVEPSVECAFCKEQCPMSSTFSTPCSHYVCRSCITRNVEICTRDETTYPPKCCDRKLPSHDVVKLLRDPSLRARYERKCAEYDTPIRDRIYCCKCTDFLGSKDTTGASSSSSSALVVPYSTLIRSVAHGALHCRRCFITTCTACRQAAHPSRLCQDTPADVAFKKLSTDKGWQKCPNCEAVVELHFGCYHIKCRCSTEFCYLCAVKWKGCSCPNAEEGRLLL